MRVKIYDLVSSHELNPLALPIIEKELFDILVNRIYGVSYQHNFKIAKQESFNGAFHTEIRRNAEHYKNQRFDTWQEPVKILIGKYISVVFLKNDWIVMGFYVRPWLVQSPSLHVKN